MSQTVTMPEPSNSGVGQTVLESNAGVDAVSGNVGTSNGASDAAAPATCAPGRDEAGEASLPTLLKGSAAGAAKAPEGRDEADSVTSETSGFSFWAKLSVPLAFFAYAFFVGAFQYVSIVYIKQFKADATVIGILTLFIIGYDLANGPYFGWLSDTGFFNRWWFRDIQRWGRRSPMSFFGMPIAMVGCTLTWVGPPASSLGPVGICVWYFCVFFLIKTGASMISIANASAITELFSSQQERKGIAPGIFVAITFGVVLGGTSVGAKSLSIHDDRTIQVYNYGFFGTLSAGCWLLMLPYFWLQRRTIFKKTLERSLPTRAAAMDALRSCASLRWFCLATHANTACFTLFTALLPWYLEIGLRFANDELEAAVQLIGMGILITILALFPLLVWLVRRFGSDRVLLVGGTAGFILHFSCHWLVYWAVPSGETDEERRKYNRVQNYLMVGLCGIAYSAVSVSWRLFEKEYFNFCVDDDQIIRAEIERRASAKVENANPNTLPGRRDGMFSALKMDSFISGAAYYPIFLVLMFPFDFNSAGEGDAQSHELQAYVCFWYNIFLPGLFALQVYAVYRFPLRGAVRLAALKERYASIFHPTRNAAEPATELQPSLEESSEAAYV